jgi:hypothetical protein
MPRSRMHEAIPPLPLYVFMAWCLVKHRGNFTFNMLRDRLYKVLKNYKPQGLMNHGRILKRLLEE